MQVTQKIKYQSIVLAALLSLSACAWRNPRPQTTDTTSHPATDAKLNVVPAKEATSVKPVTPIETTLAPSEPKTALQKNTEQDVQIVLKNAKGKIVSSTTSENSTSIPISAPITETTYKRKSISTSADQALQWLKNGNTRFIKNRLRKDGLSKKDLLAAFKEQKPHSIILASSDSRVAPELIFDQKLGEVFVVRTAGPNIDPSVIGSIEYATEHLGTNLILVLGETYSPIVRAAVRTLNGGSAGSPSLNALIAAMHPRLAGFSDATPSEHYAKESLANITGITKELIEKSEIVREATDSGSVKIKTAIYHIESGVVEF
jgi:carbonic anhydrase